MCVQIPPYPVRVVSASQPVQVQNFCWQNGYGMFSIGASQIEDVRRYIAEQEQHHRKLSFQDEFRLLLKRYELAYDERYVWD